MKQVFNRVYQCIMILCKIFLIIEILIAALVVVTRYAAPSLAETVNK